MPLVHIRVIELKCNETRNKVNYFFVNFHTDTHPDVNQKLSIDICQKNSKVLSSCAKSVSLNVDNFSQNQLYVNLKRHRMIISDDDVGKVVIPLKWFPRRKVVREWFPLTSAGKLKKTLMDNINGLTNSNQNKPMDRNQEIEYNDGSESLMLLLDIHLAKKNEKPFMAPFSAMKVLPSWKKPLLLQGSEFPPVPTTSYIVGNQPDANKNPDIPPYQSFVIVLPPDSNGSNANNTNNDNQNNNSNSIPQIVNSAINNNNSNSNNVNNNNSQSIYIQPDNTPQQQNQSNEPQIQSELQPYFPAPQPNAYTPADNLVLPPFMQGNSEATHVPLITEYMSPYSNPTNINEIFATDDIPNVYYPQVNIIEEDDDDDDDVNANDDEDDENPFEEEEDEFDDLKNDNDNDN